MIGNPLHVDVNTLKKKNFISARACIEIDAADGLPDEVLVVAINGQIQMVKVSYEWKPEICSSCCCFGHLLNACPLVTARNYFKENEAKIAVNDAVKNPSEVPVKECSTFIEGNQSNPTETNPLIDQVKESTEFVSIIAPEKLVIHSSNEICTSPDKICLEGTSLSNPHKDDFQVGKRSSGKKSPRLDTLYPKAQHSDLSKNRFAPLEDDPCEDLNNLEILACKNFREADSTSFVSSDEDLFPNGSMPNALLKELHCPAETNPIANTNIGDILE